MTFSFDFHQHCKHWEISLRNTIYPESRMRQQQQQHAPPQSINSPWKYHWDFKPNNSRSLINKQRFNWIIEEISKFKSLFCLVTELIYIKHIKWHNLHIFQSHSFFLKKTFPSLNLYCLFTNAPYTCTVLIEKCQFWYKWVLWHRTEKKHFAAVRKVHLCVCLTIYLVEIRHTES